MLACTTARTLSSVRPQLFRSVVPHLSPTLSCLGRSFHVSASPCKPPIPDDHPSHASVDPDLAIDYPHLPERDHGDWGHATTGPGIGRHSKRTLGSLSMENKVCVVTGAARGLGNLFARTFAESGSNQIVLLDVQEEHAKDAAKELVEHMVEHGEAEPGEIEAVGYQLDVSNEESVKLAFQKVKSRFGKIDVLVTAAGIVHNYEATQYPTDKMQQLFDINVNGSFYCAREAAKHMLEAELPSSIILVGSMSGAVVNVPQPQTPYNASKAAVRHMASSLAVEWAKKNIRVNCLSPGYMATSLTRTILDNNPELKKAWVNLTPAGRIGEPEDLKGAIVYLGSDASSFTTGIELRVDGGYTVT